MNSKFFFIQSLLVFLFVKTSIAQSPNFTVGPELKGTNRPLNIYLHNNELTFYAGDVASGAMGKKDLNLFRIDLNTLAPTLNKTNLTQLKYEDYTLERIFSFPEKEFVLYSSDIVNDNIMLNYQLIENASKGPFDMISLNMGKKKYPKDKPVGSFFGYNTYEGLYNDYHVSISPNKERFLYIDNIPLVNHQNPDRVPEARLLVMNTKDYKVEKELSFDLGILNFGNGVLFGNNNFAYSLVKVLQDDKSSKNYFYKIIGLSLKEGVPNFEYDVKFPGKVIETIKIELAQNGDVLCGGGYSEIVEKRRSKSMDGTFFARIHPETGKAIAEGITTLDAQVVSFLGGTLSGKIVDGIGTGFNTTRLTSFENGSVNLVFEEAGYNAKGGFNKSILVANYNSSGTLNWIKPIPKFQISEDWYDPKFVSFSVKADANKLTFVFADDEDNYDENTKMLLAENKTSSKNLHKASIKSAAVAIATINEKGEVVQKLLATTGNYACYSSTAVWNKAGDEIYFITKKSGGTHAIGKIKVQ